ncbi:MAG TPA: ATP-binding protein [Bacteroidales bacterium]|nr:ATP-binding protein [Bacteroidales bacterium]
MKDKSHIINGTIREFQYLEQVIGHRLNKYFPSDRTVPDPVIPELHEWQLPLREFVLGNNLSGNEITLLLIALAPHIQPHLFDRAIESLLPDSGNFPGIGGIRGKNSRNFLPTGDTAMFLLAGEDLHAMLEVQQLFSADHLFSRRKMLWLEELPSGEPLMSGRIIMSQDYVDLFTTNRTSKPHFGASFPAEPLETLMEWEDLILEPETMKQVEELALWIMYGKTLLYDLNMIKKIKPGYRVLFHGPPGTGKTLTASLLGRKTGKDAYKIDLSMIVSKYIGETEKNLASLFDRAEHKDWILFFDEADALFGKRTNVKDAHDKYANQEVSYLLQRVESYNGLVILATNFKSNIDEAFTRRFQSHIYFPLPRYNERLLLWQHAFPEKVTLENSLDLNALARQYELTGAHIMNIVQYACLQALFRKERTIRQADIINGIKREYSKEGKII